MCDVVKPLTSSPAIPITTWVGRKPAISSASWRATAQLSTTAPMSATVPDCMWARPWRLRPTPRTVPWLRSSISKTSALANSVPDVERRAGGELVAAVALPEAPQEGHGGSLPYPSGAAAASAVRIDGERVGEPVAAAPLALRHLGASAALPVE